MDVNTAESLKTLYKQRLGPDVAFRREMWVVLCRDFFQRYIPRDSVVMEIGAGYCEFINAIRAGSKIAVDVNPDTGIYADSDIQFIETPSSDLSPVAPNSVDVAFASNFFEHISRDEILRTMHAVRRTLKPSGRFLILQPNIRFCARDFWMFFDHITPLDQYSLAEALEMSGFRVSQTIVRFLPFTTKSKLPKSSTLVSLYLKVPIVWRLFGQQTFVVAEPFPTGR